MRILRDLRHDNVNSFIGAAINTDRILLVTDYCTKGSLYVSIYTLLIGCEREERVRVVMRNLFFQDIVENEDIRLDRMFIASLVHDLIKVSVRIHYCGFL